NTRRTVIASRAVVVTSFMSTAAVFPTPPAAGLAPATDTRELGTSVGRLIGARRAGSPAEDRRRASGSKSPGGSVRLRHNCADGHPRGAAATICGRRQPGLRPPRGGGGRFRAAGYGGGGSSMNGRPTADSLVCRLMSLVAT